MKANIVLFVILGVFFVVADAAYIIWSVLYPVHAVQEWYDGVEWVGAVAIGLSGVLSFLIAVYLRLVHRSTGGVLPEDRPDALIDDGDAEQGMFSPWSWWPVMLAGSAALVFLGVAVGFWVSFIGLAVVIVSLVGWQYEYYRGRFAH